MNTLTDITGTNFPLAPTPLRIISLAPLLSKSIYLLESADKLVGVTTYCKFPPEVQTKEKVGAVQQPDTEKIAALKPDLILATLESNKPEVIKQLKDRGLQVFVFGKKKSFGDVELRFRQIARWLNQEDMSRKILNEANLRLKSVHERIGQLPPKKVFIQLSIKPLRTVARDSFIDEIIRRSGGINIAHQGETPYPIYSLEEVITQDPEIIIIPKLGIIPTEAKERWSEFPKLTAVKQRRIFAFDAEQTHHLCSPTPLDFAQIVEEISQIIHPE